MAGRGRGFKNTPTAMTIPAARTTPRAGRQVAAPKFPRVPQSSLATPDPTFDKPSGRGKIPRVLVPPGGGDLPGLS
jgi:hypothetical protein